MTTRVPFLNKPYSAYYHRDIPREDEDLTHVGPETPCGEYLRRFWQPVSHSHELKDLPKRIRIMCEDLVLFRDQAGKVGLLELQCSHRGTSLEFGQICEQGIRCCYHGWLYDVDGKILETPGEPPDSTLKDRLHHGAYPTLEYQGLIFTYMGPPDKQPPFPIWDTYDLPGYRTILGASRIWPCNWLQMKENSMDPMHGVFLHSLPGQTLFTDAFGQSEGIHFMETPVGMAGLIMRRAKDKAWLRMNDYMIPNASQYPPTTEEGEQELARTPPIDTNWAVPIDDTHTLYLSLFHVLGEQEVDFERPVDRGFDIPEFYDEGQTADRPYEERQRLPGDYDAQIGQRPIAVHALEHLATTDRGVIMLRNMVRQGIRDVQNGLDPKGIHREAGKVIDTYSNHTVWHVPLASTPEEDRRLIHEVGRKLAEEYIETSRPQRRQAK